ncbi:hypothetical protein TWF718_007553 [Orbilia javanica]|uniref:Ankyrin n=1 Tax=Orbilia javanica TaxID=47235 RepID=A0AAN8RNN2_9PEZI
MLLGEDEFDPDALGFTQLHQIILGFDSSDLAEELKYKSVFNLVNKPDNEGRTPLLWAADLGAAREVEILLENGAEITLMDINGYCAVSMASTIKVLKLCLKDCPLSHLNNMANPRNGSLLLSHLTIGYFGGQRMSVYDETENIQRASMLIDAGADINLGTAGGVSPLTWIAQRDFPITTKFLLDSGADVNNVCRNGITVIMQTVQRDARASLAAILSEPRDFDFALKDCDGWNLLHYLAGFGSLEVIKLFETVHVAGTDADSGVVIADSKTYLGCTPMDLAVWRFKDEYHLDRIGEEEEWWTCFKGLLDRVRESTRVSLLDEMSSTGSVTEEEAGSVSSDSEDSTDDEEFHDAVEASV